MMAGYESAAAVLSNGWVLFAGGEDPGRLASAELYDPRMHAFASTGSMTWRRVWHSLTSLPNGKVLAAGGGTDSCFAGGCMFAGSVATAELYDPSAGSFAPTALMTTDRETHTATVLADGRVLLSGGVSYGNIGIFRGSLSSAELYTPDVLVPGPSLESDSAGQRAVFHAGTRHAVTADDPAAAGESVDIHCRCRSLGHAFKPQVAIGGRLATIQSIGNAPDLPGVISIRVRVPNSAAGPRVVVRVTEADRPSNGVTISLR
jgi:hypothetical protein